jgi:hypothetical protein
MIIEKIKETDYGVLQESSAGWHEEKNAYLSFVKYYMEVILSAYKELSARVELMQDRSLSKPERIRALFARTLQKLSKNMILKKCPDISVSTVELTLAALAKEGRIIKTGAGKYSLHSQYRINEISARTWAIFKCKGAMPDAIQDLWHRIYSEFFPTSDYVPKNEMDFEAYPDGDMSSSDYESEIWVAVEKK